MTYEEYKKGLTDALSNPDTALTSIEPLLESLKGDIESMETLKTKVETQDARIRDLQDTNLKLFLSQTSETENEDESKPSEAAQAVDSFFEGLNKAGGE